MVMYSLFSSHELSSILSAPISARKQRKLAIKRIKLKEQAIFDCLETGVFPEGYMVIERVNLEKNFTCQTQKKLHLELENSSIAKCTNTLCGQNLRKTGIPLHLEKKGDGVLVAVPEIYKSEQIHISHIFRNIDIVCVKIANNSYHLCLLVLYVPPTQKVNEYEELFEYVSSLYFLLDSNLLILGDLNMPELAYYQNNPASNSTTLLQNYITFIDYMNLTQRNYVLNSIDRILDMVLSNMNCEVERELNLLINEDSYHPTLSISIKQTEMGI
ncbi:hypothetical protein ILUMI_09200 [Ignelater luminosus]|uniref:Endonuclease/exonuclease/phosphatase domain-containing protein n=1 Tax=Ignelater luminosus TaxID=2038154 RepID=A0A8K0D4Q8_IGNLU|nr:hypothetical protein ILUMI_09200 [Ignelater luminosus]